MLAWRGAGSAHIYIIYIQTLAQNRIAVIMISCLATLGNHHLCRIEIHCFTSPASLLLSSLSTPFFPSPFYPNIPFPPTTSPPLTFCSVSTLWRPGNTFSLSRVTDWSESDCLCGWPNPGCRGEEPIAPSSHLYPLLHMGLSRSQCKDCSGWGRYVQIHCVQNCMFRLPQQQSMV